MALDEPSAQLYLDIRASLQAALTTRRPVLHHLNADSSWLLQIPRPQAGDAQNGGSGRSKNGKQKRKSDGRASNGGRYFYNILIDPWLAGGQSDVASWFSQQFHAEKSAVGSIGALEELLRETEILSVGLKSDLGGHTEDGRPGDSFIDIVAISHEFTDHCHKETLLEIPATVPVIASKEAANLIKSWRHFDTVVMMPAFRAGTDWRETSVEPLPEFLGISRLVQTDDVLNYHSAILFNFSATLPRSKTDTAETILYTPHGIHSTDLQNLTTAEPPLQPLALLHGLDNVRVGTVSGRTALQSNLGAHNGLKAQRVLQARYWIGTHDEVKTANGFVAWFLQREEISIKNALDRERESRRKNGAVGHDTQVEGTDDWDTESMLKAFEGVNWLQLRNGESRVLI